MYRLRPISYSKKMRILPIEVTPPYKKIVNKCMIL